MYKGEGKWQPHKLIVQHQHVVGQLNSACTLLLLQPKEKKIWLASIIIAKAKKKVNCFSGPPSSVLNAPHLSFFQT